MFSTILDKIIPYKIQEIGCRMYCSSLMKQLESSNFVFRFKTEELLNKGLEELCRSEKYEGLIIGDYKNRVQYVLNLPVDKVTCNDVLMYDNKYRTYFKSSL